MLIKHFSFTLWRQLRVCKLELHAQRGSWLACRLVGLAGRQMGGWAVRRAGARAGGWAVERAGNIDADFVVAACAPPWALVGPPWALVDPPRALVGPHWALVGPPFNPCGPPLRPCGPSLGPCRPLLGPCGPPLGMNHERNASRSSGEPEKLNATHKTD